MYDDNNIERFPGERINENQRREVPPDQDFEVAMRGDAVPPFSGEQPRVVSEQKGHDGEQAGGNDNGEIYDKNIAEAAAMINYGINAASKELGVEETVQRIKDFDASGSSDPIRDLYRYLGIDTREELNEVRDEADAAAFTEAELRESANGPVVTDRSIEGALKAIEDMKELIARVEGADPKFEGLRLNAMKAKTGYFECAIKDLEVQDLASLLKVLAEQGKEEPAKPEEEQDEEEEYSVDSVEQPWEQEERREA